MGGGRGCNREVRSVPRGTGLRMLERPAQEEESKHRGVCVCFRDGQRKMWEGLTAGAPHGSVTVTHPTGPPSQQRTGVCLYGGLQALGVCDSGALGRCDLQCAGDAGHCAQCAALSPPPARPMTWVRRTAPGYFKPSPAQ